MITTESSATNNNNNSYRNYTDNFKYIFLKISLSKEDGSVHNNTINYNYNNNVSGK